MIMNFLSMEMNFFHPFIRRLWNFSSTHMTVIGGGFQTSKPKVMSSNQLKGYFGYPK